MRKTKKRTKIFRGKDISDEIVSAWYDQMEMMYSADFEQIDEPQLCGHNPTILLIYYSVPVAMSEETKINEPHDALAIGGRRRPGNGK